MSDVELMGKTTDMTKRPFVSSTAYEEKGMRGGFDKEASSMRKKDEFATFDPNIMDPTLMKKFQRRE